jgi:O-antigen/teichoic acid export membrane protein
MMRNQRQGFVSASMADPEGPSVTAEPTPDIGLTARTMQGVRFSFVLSIVTKCASFISQVVLGWLLTKSEFGMYAAALAVFALGACGREGGMQRLLVQRFPDYPQIARPTERLALIINLCLAVLVIAAAAVVQSVTGHDSLVLLVSVLALSLIAGPFAVAPRAKVIGEMRWPQLSRAALWEALTRYGGAIVLALVGLGAYSLAIAYAAVYLTQAIVFRKMAGAPPPSPLDWPMAKGLLRDSKWLMIGSVGLVCVTMGDYLVLTLVEQKDVLGTYFFGFQLTSPLGALFVSGLAGVLTPALVQARSDPNRLRRAYVRTVSLVAATLGPATLLMAVTSPVLIHLIWQGRWDEAIPVTVLISLSLMFIINANSCYSVLDALGRWPLRTGLLLADGLGVVIAALVGALLGEVLAISIAVAIYRALSGICLTLIGGRLLGVPLGKVLRAVLLPAGISLLAAGCAFGIPLALGLSVADIGGAALALIVALLVSGTLNYILCRGVIFDAARLFLPARLKARLPQSWFDQRVEPPRASDSNNG